MNSNKNVDVTSPRYRTTFTPEQLLYLEGAYSNEQFVSVANRMALSDKLGLPEKIIKVWFQNRRMKDKRKRCPVIWSMNEAMNDPMMTGSLMEAPATLTVNKSNYPQRSMIPQIPLIAPPRPGKKQPYGYDYCVYAPFYMPPWTPPPTYLLPGSMHSNFEYFNSEKHNLNKSSGSDGSRSSETLSPTSETYSNESIKFDFNMNNSNDSHNDEIPIEQELQKPKLFQPYL